MTRNKPKMLILCNVVCYIPRYYVVCEKFLKFYVKTDYFLQLFHTFVLIPSCSHFTTFCVILYLVTFIATVC